MKRCLGSTACAMQSTAVQEDSFASISYLTPSPLSQSEGKVFLRENFSVENSFLFPQFVMGRK